MHRVFVYGTLQKGEPNYQLLDVADGGGEQVSVRYKGKGLTEERRPLVVASSYNVPYMLDKLGAGEQIHGELYEVNDEKFEHLDVLERHPVHYVRQEIPIRILSEDESPTAEVIQAWCYILPNYREEMLELPFLDRYKREAVKEMGRPYIPRSERPPNSEPVEQQVHKPAQL